MEEIYALLAGLTGANVALTPGGSSGSNTMPSPDSTSQSADAPLPQITASEQATSTKSGEGGFSVGTGPTPTAGPSYRATGVVPSSGSGASSAADGPSYCDMRNALDEWRS